MPSAGYITSHSDEQKSSYENSFPYVSPEISKPATSSGELSFDTGKPSQEHGRWEKPITQSSEVVRAEIDGFN